VQFRLPNEAGVSWNVVFDTTAPDPSGKKAVRAGELYDIQPRSTALLCEKRDKANEARPGAGSSPKAG